MEQFIFKGKLAGKIFKCWTY